MGMSFISGDKTEQFCARTKEMKKFISEVYWLEIMEKMGQEMCLATIENEGDMLCTSAPKLQASINKTTSWKRGPRFVVRYLSTKSPVRIACLHLLPFLYPFPTLEEMRHPLW